MEKETKVLRNEKGFPLLPNGEIDWELTAIEKEAIREKYEREDRIKVKHKPTNYTPPKKKRKKRK